MGGRCTTATVRALLLRRVRHEHRASAPGVARIMHSATACSDVVESVDTMREQWHDHYPTSLSVVDQADCCGGPSASDRILGWHSAEMPCREPREHRSLNQKRN